MVQKCWERVENFGGRQRFYHQSQQKCVGYHPTLTHETESGAGTLARISSQLWLLVPQFL